MQMIVLGITFFKKVNGSKGAQNEVFQVLPKVTEVTAA